MRRFLVISLIALSAMLLAAEAGAGRVKVVERKGHARTRVVVHTGFPIRRALPVVVVRRRPVVVTEHLVYASPVLWRPLFVSLPPRERLVWEDAETLQKSDGWTEVTLEVNDRGEKLYLELAGRAQLEWAEVVFGNGQAEVVDFNAGTHRPGIYSLLDFRDGRMVRYVRLLARAKSPESRITLRLQR
jgi:hypothetical protein